MTSESALTDRLFWGLALFVLFLIIYVFMRSAQADAHPRVRTRWPSEALSLLIFGVSTFALYVLLQALGSEVT